VRSRSIVVFGQYKRQLKQKRSEALAEARHQRFKFAEMRSRCIASGETPNQDLIDEFDRGMHACEEQIRLEQDVDEFTTLISQAEALGQLRAYLCPLSEMAEEASRAIDQMEDWGVSRGSLRPLRQLTATALIDPGTSPQVARGILRAVLEDWDMWMNFTDDYEEDTGRICHYLVVAMSMSFTLAVLGVNFSPHWGPLLLLSILLAGITGSCASVLARMPVSEVTSSGASESLGRRTLSRAGTGMVASVAGCALLAWGVIPIVVNGVRFSDVLSKCSPMISGQCTPTYSLVLLAVPIMFGFSERILTTLEETLFGRMKNSANADRAGARRYEQERPD
jgi:hypothetical protein